MLIYLQTINKIETGNLLANKVYTTGDASISSNLTINGNLDSSKKSPLDIKNSEIRTEFWTLASFHQGIENSGSWLQLSRDGTSNTWQAGMSSDNSYVIRAPDATNVLSVYQNGDTTSGNLDVDKILTFRVTGVSDTPPLNIINESPGGATGISYQSTASGQGCLIAYATAQSAVGWTEGVNWGSSNEFIIKTGSNGLTIESNCDTTISGNLDVGPSQAVTAIKAYVNHAGHQWDVEIKALWNSQGYVNFNTTNADGLLLIATKDVLYLYCGLNIICFLQTSNKCFR